MRYVRLVAISDDYGTLLGFALKGTPAFDGLMADRDGMMIAHDLLEHQNGTAGMGPVWDEMEALGGVWFVRGRHGDMLNGRSHFTPAHNTASGLCHMFRDWDDENGPGSMRTRPHDYDEDFTEIIAEARRMILAEYTYMDQGAPDEDEFGRSPDWYRRLDAFLALALHRMRTGFRKAARRFGGSSAYDFAAPDLFVAVRDAVKAAGSPDFEGQEYVLAYGDGEARCYPAAF